MDKREEFLKRIMATFKIEAREGIRKISSNIMELEKNPSDSGLEVLVESTFREAHSLKGASRAVNYAAVESLCQAMEGIFSSIKNNHLRPTPEILDLIQLAVNVLEELLETSPNDINEPLKQKSDEIYFKLLNAESGDIDKIGTEQTSESLVKEPEIIPEPKIEIIEKTALVEPDKPIEKVEEKPEKPSIQINSNTPEDTIRISAKKLDELMLQGEELLALKSGSQYYLKNLNSIVQNILTWNKRSTETHPLVQDIVNKLEAKNGDKTLNHEIQVVSQMVEFCEWTAENFKFLEEELQKYKRTTHKISHETALAIDSFMDKVKNAISVPFSTILDVFPQTCRNLSKDLGKEVDLIIKGDDIEIDRRILDVIRNPLMHILRNCIDHGIENPEVRKLKNKTGKGTIYFNIEHIENNKVQIRISDDGGGINLDKLKQKFRKQEGPGEKVTNDLPESTLLNYIFQSGVSTSEIITNLSGRGLGLAIVHEKIEELGGAVSVSTQKDVGTEFKIQVPLSVITFRGVHVRSGNQDFVVPTLKINKVLRQQKSAIKTFENKPGISFNDRIIPFVYLADVLELSSTENTNEYVPVLIIENKDVLVAFAVDEIRNEEEVLVKPFNKHLEKIRNISGATILSSGKVAPILNTNDLIRSAGQVSSTGVRTSNLKDEKELKSVLVVEDSITSRMLLKNILETAGYTVTTAVDGKDGFSKLKEGEFQLVVSDVDMPRMNGFDLLAKIRSDKDVSEIPVVLVTSLSKAEDRERGMEVGASAYIIKGNFDQSNLLEVVERLI